MRQRDGIKNCPLFLEQSVRTASRAGLHVVHPLFTPVVIILENIVERHRAVQQSLCLFGRQRDKCQRFQDFLAIGMLVSVRQNLVGRLLEQSADIFPLLGRHLRTAGKMLLLLR